MLSRLKTEPLVRRDLLIQSGLGVALVAAAGCMQAAPPQPAPAANPPAATAHRAVLDKYCVTCHNERLKTAGLTLEKTDLSNVAAHAGAVEPFFVLLVALLAALLVLLDGFDQHGADLVQLLLV